MMHSLPLLFRIAGKPVIVLGEGEAADAKRRLLERAGAALTTDENAAACLAFVVLDQPEGAAGRLRARGVAVNVVDRPGLCDFTVPSILERGPVLIAVGTGGVSAGLAKALRMRLEGVLPQSLGDLAERLGAARASLRQRWTNGAERRRALDDALAGGGPLDPLDAASAGRFDAWLEGAVDGGDGRFEFTVHSDDPDDLTLRQARWLASADAVFHESAVAEPLLVRARADAVRHELASEQQAPALKGRVVVIRRG